MPSITEIISPGLDSITCEFYKILKEILPVLQNIFQKRQ